MKTLFRPSLFLAQYVDYQAPYEPLAHIAKRAADLGFDGIEIPCSCNPEIFDVAKASESQAYCDDVLAILKSSHIELAGLSTRFEGQFIAVDPSCKHLCASSAPCVVRGDIDALRSWATTQLHRAAQASRRFGLGTATTTACIIRSEEYERLHGRREMAEESISQLANHWSPILEAFDDAGVDLCFTMSAGGDLHDAISIQRFLDVSKPHARVKISFNPSQFILQQLDYLQFAKRYAGFIGALEAEDLKFYSYRPGPYGAPENFFWRGGQYRTPGDGDVDFGPLFAMLEEAGYSGWSTINWNSLLRHPEDDARQGSAFIRSQALALA